MYQLAVTFTCRVILQTLRMAKWHGNIMRPIKQGFKVVFTKILSCLCIRFNYNQSISQSEITPDF